MGKIKSENNVNGKIDPLDVEAMRRSIRGVSFFCNPVVTAETVQGVKKD